MRALVLGARGAVGRVISEALRSGGDTVVPAGRRDVPGGERIDLTDSTGPAALARAAAGRDVVVNASGVEDPRIGSAVGPVPLVDISASGRYLEALAARSPADTAGIVLGAGLVPGLSTIMIEALEPQAGDDVDLMIMLGSGEAHGAAAVEWTGGLLGAPVYDAPEPHPVVNLRSGRRFTGPDGRRRRYLRADFPDQVVLGRRRGASIRSYLTLSSAPAVLALALVARVPRLRWLVTRAPHLGSAAWHLAAVDHRSGRSLAIAGVGQSRATGVLTALAARRAAAEPPGAPVSMERIIGWPEAADHLVAAGLADGPWRR